MKGHCEITEETIIDYVNGELWDTAKTKEIERHIGKCRKCAKKAKAYKDVVKAARSITAGFSDDVWAMQRESIIRKLREKKKKNIIVSFLEFVFGTTAARRAGLAFLTLLVVSGGIFYYRDYRQEIRFEREKEITEKLDFYESLEVLERLDYYKKIAREGDVL